jgi:hypothetical protein
VDSEGLKLLSEMSEYQYYEFRTIDRPLSETEIDALGAISTRAEITSTSFTNHYEWGDLKADPLKLLEKYFDAFVYVANWGTRRFRLRLPKAWIEYEKAKRMLPGGAVWAHQTRKHVIVGFDVSELELDDFDDGTGWMGSLVSLRSDLLRGDFRCLYLGWLLCAQIGELGDGEREPPVPANLRQLTAPLRSLIDFLCIDEDLVEAAAAASARLNARLGDQEFEAWIRNLPENEKTNLLVTVTLEPGERWKNELLARFYREKQQLASPVSASQPRTVGDLLSAAKIIAQERATKLAVERTIELARRKAEEEATRARYLDLLAKRQEATWDQVNQLIQKKQPKAYDQAIRLLVDLRDLAVRQDLEATFKARTGRLCETHRAKTSFLKRLTEATL